MASAEIEESRDRHARASRYEASRSRGEQQARAAAAGDARDHDRAASRARSRRAAGAPATISRRSSNDRDAAAAAAHYEHHHHHHHHDHAGGGGLCAGCAEHAAAQAQARAALAQAQAHAATYGHTRDHAAAAGGGEQAGEQEWEQRPEEEMYYSYTRQPASVLMPAVAPTVRRGFSTKRLVVVKKPRRAGMTGASRKPGSRGTSVASSEHGRPEREPHGGSEHEGKRVSAQPKGTKLRLPSDVGLFPSDPARAASAGLRQALPRRQRSWRQDPARRAATAGVGHMGEHGLNGPRAGSADARVRFPPAPSPSGPVSWRAIHSRSGSRGSRGDDTPTPSRLLQMAGAIDVSDFDSNAPSSHVSVALTGRSSIATNDTTSVGGNVHRESPRVVMAQSAGNLLAVQGTELAVTPRDPDAPEGHVTRRSSGYTPRRRSRLSRHSRAASRGAARSGSRSGSRSTSRSASRSRSRSRSGSTVLYSNVHGEAPHDQGTSRRSSRHFDKVGVKLAAPPQSPHAAAGEAYLAHMVNQEQIQTTARRQRVAKLRSPVLDKISSTRLGRHLLFGDPPSSARQGGGGGTAVAAGQGRSVQRRPRLAGALGPGMGLSLSASALKPPLHAPAMSPVRAGPVTYPPPPSSRAGSDEEHVAHHHVRPKTGEGGQWVHQDANKLARTPVIGRVGDATPSSLASGSSRSLVTRSSPAGRGQGAPGDRTRHPLSPHVVSPARSVTALAPQSPGPPGPPSKVIVPSSWIQSPPRLRLPSPPGSVAAVAQSGRRTSQVSLPFGSSGPAPPLTIPAAVLRPKHRAKPRRGTIDGRGLAPWDDEGGALATKRDRTRSDADEESAWPGFGPRPAPTPQGGSEGAAALDGVNGAAGHAHPGLPDGGAGSAAPEGDDAAQSKAPSDGASGDAHAPVPRRTKSSKHVRQRPESGRIQHGREAVVARGTAALTRSASEGAFARRHGGQTSDGQSPARLSPTPVSLYFESAIGPAVRTQASASPVLSTAAVRRGSYGASSPETGHASAFSGRLRTRSPLSRARPLSPYAEHRDDVLITGSPVHRVERPSALPTRINSSPPPLTAARAAASAAAAAASASAAVAMAAVAAASTAASEGSRPPTPETAVTAEPAAYKAFPRRAARAALRGSLEPDPTPGELRRRAAAAKKSSAIPGAKGRLAARESGAMPATVPAASKLALGLRGHPASRAARTPANPGAPLLTVAGARVQPTVSPDRATRATTPDEATGAPPALGASPTSQLPVPKPRVMMARPPPGVPVVGRLHVAPPQAAITSVLRSAASPVAGAPPAATSGSEAQDGHAESRARDEEDAKAGAGSETPKAKLPAGPGTAADASAAPPGLPQTSARRVRRLKSPQSTNQSHVEEALKRGMPTPTPEHARHLVMA